VKKTYCDHVMDHIWSALVAGEEIVAEALAWSLLSLLVNGCTMPRGLSKRQVVDWLADLDLI
jgi:hypothetical protein